MNAPRVLSIRTESFLHLVGRLKRRLQDADIFEIDLDAMRVKGDLAVIQKHFEKPMIARSQSVDLLKRGIKANFAYAELPWNFTPDPEFESLLKNKNAQWIWRYEKPEDLLEFPKHGLLLLEISDAPDHRDLLTDPRFQGRLTIRVPGGPSVEGSFFSWQKA